MKRAPRRALALIGLVVVASMATGCGGDGPKRTEHITREYAGFDRRPIRALSPKRVADLLAGRGAGYALAAELNQYPGPMHVLELAGELELTARQEHVARQLAERNHREARPLGRRLVALEAQLDRAFRSGKIRRSTVERLTGEIAAVEAELRATHLTAHLGQRDALDPAQVHRYNRLRGYRSRTGHTSGRGHHGHEGP